MSFNARENKVESFEESSAEVRVSSSNSKKSNGSRNAATEPLSSFMEATTLHGAELHKKNSF